MALQNLGWSLAVVLSDIGGNKFTLRYSMTAADYTNAAIDRTTIINALDAVTNCVLVSHTLSEKVAEDGPVFGSAEGENQAAISAKLVAPGKPDAQISIPAPIDAMFVGTSGPDYNQVNPANVPLVSYVALFEAGAEATISDGDSVRDSSVAGNFTGKRIHKASRKG